MNNHEVHSTIWIKEYFETVGRSIMNFMDYLTEEIIPHSIQIQWGETGHE